MVELGGARLDARGGAPPTSCAPALTGAATRSTTTVLEYLRSTTRSTSWEGRGAGWAIGSAPGTLIGGAMAQGGLSTGESKETQEDLTA
jgi:hypothetical protein